MPPDSIDWEAMPPPENRQDCKVHLHTEFADTEPLSEADVYVFLTPMTKDFAYRSLDKIGIRYWKQAMEGHLSNPRQERESTDQLGGVDAYGRDVQGDYIAGVHQVTWSIAKNGKFIYTFMVQRSYKAVGDEDLDAEIKAIRESFKFLKIEKPVKHEAAKKEDVPAAAPDAGGGGGDTKGPKEDPEKLKEERIKETFWRFEAIKPEGLLAQKLDENEKKQGIKYKFMNDRQGCRLLLRIYGQTDKSQTYTIEQLMQHKLDYWVKETTQRLPDEIDKKYKFPLAKDAVRLELVGRASSGVKIKRIWILAECKNDRQYQLEIYITGASGEKVWQEQIEKFLKEFQPSKK